MLILQPLKNSSDMKSRLFLLIMFAMLGIPSIANASPLSLLIHLADGTEIVCALDREPQMLFGEKTITLTSLTGTVGQWNFADVESWVFSDVEDPDAIDNVKDGNARIKIEGGQLTILNSQSTKANGQVAIYDTDGRLVTPSLKTANGMTNISLNGFAKGTYLLKTGNTCVKFLVK